MVKKKEELSAHRTDPDLWERVKKKITKSDKGGLPGQWSARKAQLAVQEYKRLGGGYIGKKNKNNSLSVWTREEWGTLSGKPSIQGKNATGERYLPKAAREMLSKTEYDATSDKKRKGIKSGKQFVKNTKKAKEARRIAHKRALE
jgi:hypothetical protein